MNLNQALQTNSIDNLHSIIQQIDEDISFFGFRFAYNKVSKEAIPLNSLADHIMEIAKKKKFEFEEEERVAGRAICQYIDNLYEKNAKRIEDKPCLTQTMCKIRDFWRSLTDGYGTTYKWKEEEENEMFDLYTKKQYEAKFGPVPIDYPNCSEYSNDKDIKPNRWVEPRVKQKV